MFKSNLFTADGVVAQQIKQGNKPRSKVNAERIERKNRQKSICLNCDKEKCKGSQICFEKEMREKEKDENGNES